MAIYPLKRKGTQFIKTFLEDGLDIGLSRQKLHINCLKHSQRAKGKYTNELKGNKENEV